MVNKNNAKKAQKRPATPAPPAPRGLNNAVTGAVYNALKKLPKGTFAAVGGLAGPKGAALGSVLSQITGFGDYEVGGNGTTTHGGDVPHFANHPDRTIIKHREFVGPIKSPGTAFTNTTYDINPGNKKLFPWLSGVAKSYQQYKILGMAVVYKPLTSDYAAAGGMGQVIMATNYNVNDAPFSSTLQMENSEYAVAVKPSKGAIHPIECAAAVRRNDPFYVYDELADVASASDMRFYNMGKFQVATEGVSSAADVTLGQLWVTYEIELIKPILPSGADSGNTLTPSYWSAQNYSTVGGWEKQYSLDGIVVDGMGASGGFEITLTGYNGKEVIILYHALAEGLLTATTNVTNLDITTGPLDVMAHHSQRSNSSGSGSSLTGHISGKVFDDIATITVNAPAGTAYNGGWVYVYAPN